MTYRVFKDFLESRGAKLPAACPICNNQELWNIDKSDPDKIFGSITYEEIEHILGSPNYNHADFGSFMVECGYCGHNIAFLLAALVEKWHADNG